MDAVEEGEATDVVEPSSERVALALGLSEMLADPVLLTSPVAVRLSLGGPDGVLE